MIVNTIIYKKEPLYQLDLTRLQAGPNQTRKDIDTQALEELDASIAKYGVLEPILFRVAEDHQDVVVGERRIEAAKKADLPTIPAISLEGNHAEIALVGNPLRLDRTAIEEAEALLALMTEQNYPHEQLAGIISKARATITEILSLSRLPQEIREECRNSSAVARRTLVEIALKKQARGVATVWNQYKNKTATAAEGRK